MMCRTCGAVIGHRCPVCQPDRWEHGTIAGYQRHIRNKETACLECRQARNEYTATRRANDPNFKPEQRARRAATQELKKVFPATYAKYLAQARDDEGLPE